MTEILEIGGVQKYKRFQFKTERKKEKIHPRHRKAILAHTVIYVSSALPKYLILVFS